MPPEGPVHTCRFCGRPFADPELLALHRGLAHPDPLADAERTAYDAAREAEQAAIRRFRWHAVGALVLLYFGFLMAYALL